jgi:hypothetical protein
MGTAKENRPVSMVAGLLAGLQAGTGGALWMMAYMGVAAMWDHLSFWTYENLFATFFYGSGALHPGFSMRTVSGMALIVAIYAALGALFAVAAAGRASRLRTLLLGVVFGLAWYYLSFRLLWKAVMPLAAMLHPERPTMVAHLVYGLSAGRFPAYLEKPSEPAATPVAAEPAEHSTPAGTAAAADPPVAPAATEGRLETQE